MGFLSQTLTTTPGAVYLVSFWLDSPAATKPNDFQVSWNGNVLIDKTNLTAIGWTNIQMTVTARAPISTLQFGYLNGYFYFGLDDVTVLPVAQLGIIGIILAGANLMFNGVGGESNRTYYVLMGTNLTESFNQWTPVATNLAGADGNFSIIATNAVTPNVSQRFYILQLPGFGGKVASEPLGEWSRGAVGVDRPIRLAVPFVFAFVRERSSGWPEKGPPRGK